jgi:ferritin-like metal-binding protein YciE
MINEYLELCKQHAQAVSNLIKGPSPAHPSHHRAVDALLRRALDISEKRGDQTLLDLGITFVMREIEMVKISGYEASKLVAEVVSANESLKTVERCLLDEQQAERAWVVLGEDMIDTVGSEVMRRAAADRGVAQAGV